MKKLIIDLDVDDLYDGIELISIVNRPAIQSNFVKLSEEDPLKVSLTVNSERQELTGAVLIPNIEIRRVNEKGEEYFIKFTEEAIIRIKRKFVQTGKLNLSNLDHSEKDEIKAVLTDIWTVEDSKNDRALVLGLTDLVKGSLMVTYHIPDSKVWQHIKDGEYHGFSLEGMFKKNQALSENNTPNVESLLSELSGLLNEILEDDE